MEPPAGAVETPHSFLWIHEGILMERTKAVRSTIESVEELFDVIDDLSGDTPRPFLFDIRVWKGGSSEAWKLAVEKTLRHFSAVAVLIDPDSPSVTSLMPKAIGKLLIPVRFFVDENEALEFLRRYVSPD
jgi:hypothetical protein